MSLVLDQSYFRTSATTENAITAQEHYSKEDMSLVLHNTKTDATTSFTAAKPRHNKTAKVCTRQ